MEQNSGAALHQITAVLGANIVIDPAIQFLPAKTRTLYLNDVKDDIFDYLSDYIVRNESVEKWKSLAGTYFFDAKPAVTFNGLMGQLGELRLQNSDPLTSRFGVKSQATPQPDWRKREFNGRGFYYIPGPKLPG